MWLQLAPMASSIEAETFETSINSSLRVWAQGRRRPVWRVPI